MQVYREQKVVRIRHPGLLGIGFVAFSVGIVQVVAGVVITGCSGGLGAVAGAALVGSGIEGAKYGWQEEECKFGKYFKKSLIGRAIGGLIAGVSSGATYSFYCRVKNSFFYCINS